VDVARDYAFLKFLIAWKKPSKRCIRRVCGLCGASGARWS